MLNKENGCVCLSLSTCDPPVPCFVIVPLITQFLSLFDQPFHVPPQLSYFLLLALSSLSILPLADPSPSTAFNVELDSTFPGSVC